MIQLWHNYHHPAIVIHKLLAAYIAQRWQGNFIRCYNSPMC